MKQRSTLRDRLARLAARARRRSGEEDGFVLTVVVFALAALSIGATAAFLIVESETRMADGGLDGTRAFQLAQAGLQRYMAEEIGAHPDSASYTMGGGVARVRAERVLSFSDTAAIYLITSEGVVDDPRTPNLPARRTVKQLARLERWGARPTGALTMITPSAMLGSITADGRDTAAPGTCTAAGAPIAGISALSGGGIATMGTDNQGSPALRRDDLAAMQRNLGVEWAMLTDPAIPFQYEFPSGSWPNFTALGAGTFPMIRVDGNFSATQMRSGRGLLVVTGDIRFYDDFEWDGVILAGGMASFWNTIFSVDGALVVGMDALGGGSPDYVGMGSGAQLRYNSCNVFNSVQNLARLTAVENTWWEADY